MTSSPKQYIGLDVGEKRIGVARGDSRLRLAYPLETIQVDGSEMDRIKGLVLEQELAGIVVGFPRNLSGETTRQTEFVEAFAEQLKQFGVDIFFQDESLTSVVAEQHLQTSKKFYEKSAVDARAACIILQDYLEITHGR